MATVVVAIFSIAGCGGGGGDGGGGEPPPPPAPRAFIVTETLDEDTELQGTLTGAAGAGGTLTFNVLEEPDHGTLVVSGADYTYTPDPDFFGLDSILFNVTENGRTSVPALVTLLVEPVNDPPVASDGMESGNEDEVIQSSVPALDIDSGDLTLAIVTDPTSGVLTPGAGLEYSYTPAPNFFGQDSFTYTVSDGFEVTAERTISIDVLPVNDPPELSSAAINIAAGAVETVDMTGSDIENDTLSYRLGDNFTQASVVNDPTDSGMFDIETAYGTFGADQATVIANDSLADSAAVTLDIDIQVPVTTPGYAFNVFDGERSAYADAVAEGPDGSIYVAGNVTGQLVNPSPDFTNRVFIARHDETGLQTDIETFDDARLTNFSIGFDNGLLTTMAVNVNDPLVLRTLSLDLNGDAATDTSVTVPYAIARTSRQLETLHADGEGFFAIGNDNRLHRVSYAGALVSTQEITDALTNLVSRYKVADLRVVGDQVVVTGGIFVCDDDGSSCSGGSGTQGFILRIDLSGAAPAMVALPGFPRDAKVLEDGRVVAHVDESLYLVNEDGSVVWQRDIDDTFLGAVGIGGDGDIYWWAFDSVDLMFIASRITIENELVWQTMSAYTLLGSLFLNGMHVDQYGNLFVSLVEQYNISPDGFGRIVNAHVDYSGVHQWTVISEPSDMNANGLDGRNASLLSSSYRLVTIASDGRGGGFFEADGYVFFNTITPAPP